ncbi:radical SAM protein [Tissierella sp. MB52-C2]|uniref:radical SAM/SPASM domain-containing protein n=1 Tax=Tissierella sp. MB52-C2 TaxID=3070999 RepID=UPI00280B7192|nr:radical SAM protein [Tissierella sp. MB52-C2]WMM26569.1 radical SAM protein [Tissierella sp. MB52-C2]
MLVTLWITTQCNMKCRYCYEGNDKTNKMMSIETADKSIQYIMKHFNELNEDTLIINFHGGEPLLQFDLIKYITEEFKQIFSSSNKRLMFGLTTNGILLDEKIEEYLCENFYYSLSASLDGNKLINDTNRMLKNGRGTYDLVIDKFVSLLKIRQDVRIRMTFNTDTVYNLYESVQHLVEMGFNTIIPVADYFDDRWDKHHIDILCKETEKIFEMFKREKEKNSNLSISIVDVEIYKKGNCGGGITTLNIDPNGDIYPCTYVVEDEEYRIGNIDTGIDKIKLQKIHSIFNTKNEICNGCSYYNCCSATRCKLINKVLTDNFNMPSPVMCAIENIMYKFSKYNLKVS